MTPDVSAATARRRIWISSDESAPRIPGGPIQTNEQRKAIRRLAQSCLDGDTRYAAALDTLHRRPIEGSPYLFVQGPPGSGKTRWGAHEIVRLLGEGIGVSANSHKAIHNLLDEVEKVSKLGFAGLKKGVTGVEPEVQQPPLSHVKYDSRFHKPAGATHRRNVVALRARGARSDARCGVHRRSTSDCAGKLVGDCDVSAVVYLLGDPLQLAQVSQARHPGISGASVLEHLLGEHATTDRSGNVPRTPFQDASRRLSLRVRGCVREPTICGRRARASVRRKRCASRQWDSIRSRRT